MAMNARVLAVTTAAVDDHDTGPGHPERAARLEAALAGVRSAALGADLALVAPRPATRAELARVHDATYLDALERFCVAGGGMLDPDTVATPASWSTALAAAGSGLAAIDALDRGDATSALVLARPPGHHATRARAQGFCLLNTVAVAAAALVARGEQVLVVDWDVHHGNGTQDIFWNEPNVLYASTHQWPAYPGTGRISETGGPGAPGLTVNFRSRPAQPVTWRGPRSTRSSARCPPASRRPGCWCRPGSTPTGPTRSPICAGARPTTWGSPSA
jgi:acetoin utilization deacetylase AcuC-like enzyme